jgi:hypothetical protein
VDGGDDAIGLGELEKGIVEPDLDLGEIERIIANLDSLAAQVVGDAVAVPIEGEGGGFGDLAGVTMEKGLAEGFGVGGTDGGSGVLADPFQGCLTGLGVALGVILAFRTSLTGLNHGKIVALTSRARCHDDHNPGRC